MIPLIAALVGAGLATGGVVAYLIAHRHSATPPAPALTITPATLTIAVGQTRQFGVSV